MFANPGRDRFQPLERSRGERKEPPLRPPRVGRPPATGRHAEPTFDVRPQLHCPEIAEVAETFPLRSAPSAAAILSMFSCVFTESGSLRSRRPTRLRHAVNIDRGSSHKRIGLGFADRVTARRSG